MRKPRLKIDGEGFYHVTSRCVDRTFRFKDADKTRIVDQMKRMGNFCGVEIGTYAVMSNHFHILLHVLEPKELTDDELVERIAALYGTSKAEDLRCTWAFLRKAGNQSSLEQLEASRQAYLRRMGDLSVYMKELKQWISRIYNKEHNRKGTLWEERFWSCLLEDSAETLTSVASYIDCNAVRAGIVERPEDYRWCGYAEAHAGHAAAQRTLASLFRQSEDMAWAEAQERYSWLLRPVTDTADAVTDTGSGRREERNPAFTRALAMGSRSFILETYARFPKVFTAKRRPMQPYVTDNRTDESALCASHRPREAVIG
jgi:REP element-mobilizing transposase RayT